MRRAAAVFWLAAITVLPAEAQTGSSRLEVIGGGGLLGGAGLGSDDADLRANDPGRQPFRLFTADSRIARGRALHLRALVRLNERFAVESGLTWSRPDLRTSVGMDAEGASPIVMAERLDQYFIDAGLLVMLSELRIGRAIVPFVTAGGGYLRQLHEGKIVIEHGQVYHAGGGVKYPFVTRARGLVRAVGLRGDARVYLMRGGVSFSDRPRPHVAVSGGVFVGF